MIRFAFSLWLLIAPIDLLAQVFTPDPDLRFENFNGQNHFISVGISDIAVDKHGYVWTSNTGIQRFDGYRTVDFNSFDRTKSGLRDNSTDIIADNDGRIWVSSAGLCYYNDVTGKFIYIQPDRKHNSITNVFSMLAQKNYLWFVCDYGLARVDLRSLKMSFTSLTGIANPLGTFLLDDNTLLISSREKVYTYNIKADTYSANTLIHNHSLLKIFAACKSDKTIFLGTNFGLFTFKNLKNISVECPATKDVSIGDLLFLPQDKEKKYLFAGTEGKGILVYNTVSRKIEFTYTHDENNPGSLTNNVISKIIIDNKARLWIATSLGISMLDVGNQQWKVRFLSRGEKSDAGEISINNIAVDKYDSTKVWMSCFNQGIIRINWTNKKIEKAFYDRPEMQKIYDFAQISKNRWLIATPKKILEWDPRKGILFSKKLPVPDSLDLVYGIRRIIFADANNCFITTNIGLFKYDLGTHEIINASVYNIAKKNEDPLKYDLITGYYDSGGLWIASRNGLFYYDIAKKATTFYRGQGRRPDYFFFDITSAANNRIVCASEDGIAIFNRQTKSFQVINSIANLSNPNCLSVTSINNTLWIGTNAGILNYDLATGKSSRAEQETRQMETFATSSFMHTGSDLVFGIRNGFAWFTSGLKNISIPSNPVIERVFANNQPVLKQYPSETSGRQLVFGHSDNSINIGFTAFFYADPDHINFRYRLKGADPKWQYAEDQRSANYAQLEPGDYTFYVQSGNKNGVWNNHLASFNFIIAPPYWQTWWFRIVVALLIGMGLYRLYLYKIENIKEIESIRARIASDFHDDLGSTLTSISIFSEVAIQKADNDLNTTKNMVSDMGMRARAMIHSMNDMVWTIKPENDNLYRLMQRMEEFGYPVAEAKEIRLRFFMDQHLYDIKMDMLKRKNLFLIFKEAFNNAVKYSSSDNIDVHFELKHKKLIIMQIIDNGCGFEYDKRRPGNGLANMQKRAAEVKGKLTVSTAMGGGTSINIICKIA